MTNEVFHLIRPMLATADQWIMIGIAVTVAAVSALATYYLTPKPKEPGVGELGFPSSEEGTPIQYVFGTYDVPGHYMWPRDKAHMQKQKSSTATNVSWASALCHGPITELREIRWDDCPAYPHPDHKSPVDSPIVFPSVTAVRDTTFAGDAI